MNLTGTWNGTYSYDQIEELPKLPSRPITFEMTLKQHFLGITTGTTKDDPRYGFPEPGKIRGKLSGASFRFGKHFPKLRVLHEAQSLIQWAERWKFALEDPDEPHPTIHFLGTLSADGQSLAGSWRSPESEIIIPGASGPLRLPTLTGSWSATRT